MLKKSYSQKIAGVFAIVNFLMVLVPIAFGALLLVFAPWTILLVAFIWLCCSPGLWLTVQYFKHLLGELDEEQVPFLWIATIGFNGMFLLVSLCWIHPNYNSSDQSLYPRTLQTIEVGWIVLVIWWTSAILFSFTALRSERRQKNRFSNRFEN